MSSKNKNFFRYLFLCVAIVSILILTACGHHHDHNSSSTPQPTSTVSLSIDATDFNVNSSLRLQTNTDSDFVVSTTGYDNGKPMTTLTDVKAEKNGSKYECKISGLINAYDYRFTFKYKGTPVMQNQISKYELQNDAETPVDINVDTSLKTLAYDSWLSKNPSNASFGNFEENCANQGIVKPEDFRAFIALDDYKAKLAQIAKGEKVSVPTKSDVNTDSIPTADAEKEVSEILGTWYLNTINKLPVVVTDNGDVETLVLNSDRTFTWTNYDMAECPDENPEFWQTEKVSSALKGTWKYSNGSLTVKVDGSDGSEVSTPITLKNDELTIVDTDEETHETDTNVYKKTKNTYKPTVNKALEGSWYLNEVDGIPVVPNSIGNVDKYIFNSDGTFSYENYDFSTTIPIDSGKPNYLETAENGETYTGTWKYADGKLTLKIDKEEHTLPITIKNAELAITETVENETSVSIFRKNQNSYDPIKDPIKEAIIGTWFLNSEDNLQVVPNSKNEVVTWVINEDNTIEIRSYDLEALPNPENPQYYQTGDTCETVSGTWSYEEGKLTTLCNGEELIIPISFEDDVLTLTEDEFDEDTGESYTSVSVLKKTKPSLQ